MRFGTAGSALFARRHHRHLDRRRQLDARLAHRARRRRRAVQHDARRDRSGRRRLGPLRDARARRRDGVPERPDGGPHAGVPRQEDRPARDRARRRLRADDPDPRAGRQRRRPHRARRAGGAAGGRAARPHRGGLRRHLGVATTTARPSAGSRRARRSGTRCSALCMLVGRFLPIVLVLALAGRFAASEAAARRAPAPCRPTGPCSSACCRASPWSWSVSPTCRCSPSARSWSRCHEHPRPPTQVSERRCPAPCASSTRASCSPRP